MAYTTLATQSAGQTASAAGWANVVKANFEAMGPHLIVRKTSDQSVVSSQTLVNDTALILPLGANEIWQFTIGVIHSGVTDTGDIKIAFTFPAAGEIMARAIERAAGGTAPTDRHWNGTTTPTTSFDFQGPGASVKEYFSIEGVFINAGTAGNLTMQWAQQQSNATATIVRANSTLWAVKLA